MEIFSGRHLLSWKSLYLLTGLFSCLLTKNLTASDTLQYSIVHYTDENGLPQNSIKSIALDKAGFTWLGTEDGLVRFDGKNFKVFNSEILPLRSNRVIAIVPGDKPGQFLALLTEAQCIEIYNGSVMVQPDSVAIKSYEKYHHSSSGPMDIYVASGLPNVFKEFIRFEKYAVPVDQAFSYMISSNGIEYYKGQTKQAAISFPGSDFWQYFALGGSLYYLDRVKNKLAQIDKDLVLTKNITGDILRNSFYKARTPVKIFWNRTAGQVFFECKGSLYMVKPTVSGDLHTQYIASLFETAKSDIVHILYDERHRQLFMGSVTYGLYVFTRKQFVSLFLPGADDQVFYAQVAYDSNNVIVPNGYIFGLSGSKVVPQMKSRVLKDKYSIAIDSSGNTWTKSGEKLYCYYKRGDRQPHEWSLRDEITQLYKGNDGTIWIGMQTKGLFRLHEQKDGTKSPEVFIDKPLDISCMAEDSGGTLWIGTTKGAYMLNVAMRQLDSIPGLTGKHVRSINCSQPGEVWITTYGNGFYLYMNKNLTRFPVDKNKYLLMSHCFLKDKNNYCWIPTNRGLFQASYKDLLDYANGQLKDVFYLYYDKDAGFATNEFNGGCEPCGVKLKNGYFALPSINGSVWFNPDHIRPALPDKDIFIDRLEVDQKPFISGDTIHLKRSFSQLKIFVSTPYYGNLYNVRVSFALYGTKDRPVWLQADDNRIISLSSLPSGTYHLRIRKASGFGKDNWKYKEIILVIPPAFYETWWFIVACALLLLLFIWLYTKFRFRYIRHANKILAGHIESHTRELKIALAALQHSENKLKQHTRLQDRLLAAIAHDIKSPLKFISMVGKGLFYKLEKQENQFAKDAKLLTDESYRVFLLSDNLLQYIKFYSRTGSIVFEKVDLHAIVEEKINIFRDIARSVSSTIINNVSPAFFVNSNKILLNVIIHNLLDNATKVTRNGSIRIFAVVGDKEIQIIIEDTGPGMIPELVSWCNDPDVIKDVEPVNSIATGLGLLIVKELIASIDGRFRAESELGKGTKMILVFKEPG